jgi:hypothetical protein
MERRRDAFSKGLQRKKKPKVVNLEPEGKALFCLSADTKFRKALYKLVKDDRFDAFIIIVILISTASLCFQNPTYDPNSKSMKFFKALDFYTTLIFTGECMLKIMALGFAMNGPSSYLRTAENVFDFIIVLSALLALAASDDTEGVMAIMGKLKTLRVMRVVRPLRIISRSENLKIAINALIVSIPQLINLTIFVFLFFFLFGIFGVNYFKGCYYECMMENVPEWA